MYYYEVAPIIIARIDSNYFTYSSDDQISIGTIVQIELGKQKNIGIIIKKTKKPTYPTKSILAVIETTPVPTPLIKTALWMSEYYLTPLATVLQTILPRGVDKSRHIKDITTKTAARHRTNILFNNDQTDCLSILSRYTSGTFLLQGITGSGKTEVYIEIAKRAINSGKSAIILVPEIALTSQLIAELANHFTEELIVTHSKMTESERHQIWTKILKSDKLQVIVGPRSALFMPARTIGAIIIDEAHETSYKQEQSPKYSALRAATILGKFHNSIVIFGSATPNIIDRFLAEKSDKPILRLNKVARINSLPPTIELVDMTKKTNFSQHRFISDLMINQIKKTTSSGGQVLIFHNRRGSANITQCQKCGWNALCNSCFIPMSLHTDKFCLTCHACGKSQPVPVSCPICHDANIVHKGIGTKLIESEITKLFPDAVIARFDNDNKDSETIDQKYQDIYDGKINIIIGTQVVAKGLDLPNLRTVCVIQADSGLALPDYNSNERAFQLIAQVVGRVGRNEHKTNVIIQTYQPNHSSIIYGLKQDYESFYEDAINERRRSHFPPFVHLLKFNCAFKTEAAAIKSAKEFAVKLKNTVDTGVTILGPMPSFYERLNGKYHWQIILKSPKREYLIKAIKLLPKNNWQFELEPTSLLK